MPDDFIIDNLHGIIDSIELIEIRFAGIAKSDDFVKSADGVLMLDSINVKRPFCPLMPICPGFWPSQTI